MYLGQTSKSLVFAHAQTLACDTCSSGQVRGIGRQ